MKKKAKEYQQASKDLLYSVLPKNICMKLEAGCPIEQTWQVSENPMDYQWKQTWVDGGGSGDGEGE